MSRGGVLTSGKSYQSQQAGLRRTFTDLLSAMPELTQAPLRQLILLTLGYTNLKKNASYWVRDTNGFKIDYFFKAFIKSSTVIAVRVMV